MYGEWQLGHVPFDEVNRRHPRFSANTLSQRPPVTHTQFVQRHRRFAFAMRKVSPAIKIIGVGALHVAAVAGQEVALTGKGAWGFDTSWTGLMMSRLLVSGHGANATAEAAAGRSAGAASSFAPHSLQALSEHFYVDTEKPTAAQHAKQVGSTCHCSIHCCDNQPPLPPSRNNQSAPTMLESLTSSLSACSCVPTL
jgi:hypothetical protein